MLGLGSGLWARRLVLRRKPRQAAGWSPQAPRRWQRGLAVALRRLAFGQSMGAGCEAACSRGRCGGRGSRQGRILVAQQGAAAEHGGRGFRVAGQQGEYRSGRLP